MRKRAIIKTWKAERSGCHNHLIRNTGWGYDLNQSVNHLFAADGSLFLCIVPLVYQPIHEHDDREDSGECRQRRFFCQKCYNKRNNKGKKFLHASPSFQVLSCVGEYTHHHPFLQKPQADSLRRWIRMATVFFVHSTFHVLIIPHSQWSVNSKK